MKNMNGKNIDYKEVLSKLGPLLALVLVSIVLSIGTEQFMTVGNIIYCDGFFTGSQEKVI